MNDSQKIKQSSFSTATAVATGIVVGAGAVIASVVALKDKKNAEIVKKVLNNVKAQSITHGEEMKKQALEAKKLAEQNIAEGKEKAVKVAKVAEDAKKGLKSL
jgi:hypothetical protein